MKEKKGEGGDLLQNGPDKQGSPSADTGGQGASPGNKVRVKNEKYKDGKIFLGNGKLAEFDANGIAEIDAMQAKRLLAIPGYEKA
jgi:hypothetical protein